MIKLTVVSLLLCVIYCLRPCHLLLHFFFLNLLGLGSKLHFTQAKICSERFFSSPKPCTWERAQLRYEPETSKPHALSTTHTVSIHVLMTESFSHQLNGHHFELRGEYVRASWRRWGSGSPTHFQQTYSTFGWLYTLGFPIKFHLSRAFRSKWGSTWNKQIHWP